MKNKLNPKAVSFSLASVAAILYIICAIFFAIAPGLTLTFFKDMFHGLDITKIARTGTPIGSVTAGFVEIVISALVIGWLFTVIYNWLLVRKNNQLGGISNPKKL